MDYKLLYTQSAAKDIKKLDPVVKKRIGKKFYCIPKILCSTLKSLRIYRLKPINEELGRTE